MNGTSDADLRVVIVDDEEPARRVLREYLSGEPGVRIVAECADGFEAVKAITETEPDLVFLDIQMPKLDGFEVVGLIGAGVGIIFVTAYDEYALRAFEVHAIDYLLKPFGPERLSDALARARAGLSKGPRRQIAGLVAETRSRGKPLERVLVRDGPRVHVIPADRIDYVQAQDDYVSYRANGKEYLKQESLSELEKLLDPQRFIRIHRSYILNVERLARIELYAKDSRMAILADGSKLPISRSGYARLKPLL